MPPGLRLALHRQFVTGGEQRHPQAAEHLEARRAHRGGDDDMGGGEPRAGGQHLGSGGDVLAAAADPLAQVRHVVHRQPIAVDGADFLHHHGIGAGRHRGAGEDACRRSRRQRMADASGGDALGDLQHRAGMCDVGAAQRIAIHRGVVQRRHVDRRAQAHGKHAAGGGLGGDGLGLAQWAPAGEQARERLVVVKHGAH